MFLLFYSNTCKISLELTSRTVFNWLHTDHDLYKKIPCRPKIRKSLAEVKELKEEPMGAATFNPLVEDSIGEGSKRPLVVDSSFLGGLGKGDNGKPDVPFGA